MQSSLAGVASDEWDARLAEIRHATRKLTIDGIEAIQCMI